MNGDIAKQIDELYRPIAPPGTSIPSTDIVWTTDDVKTADGISTNKFYEIIIDGVTYKIPLYI